MARRRAEWTAVGLPRLRRQTTHALTQQAASLRSHAARMPSHPKTRNIPGVADGLDTLRDAVARADLYWVTSAMTALARQAAPTLPDWTPSRAPMTRYGLLVWAEPVGTVPWQATDDITIDVPVDAIAWRPDDVDLVWVEILSRRRGWMREHLYGPTRETPLIAVRSLRLDDRLRLPDLPLVSVIGATWLLMREPKIAAPTIDRAPEGGGGREPKIVEVTTYDLRRLERPKTSEEGGGESRREYKHRWVVRGHWRQQACGPGLSERRPRYIGSYVKGPADAPLIGKDRVNVWRR